VIDARQEIDDLVGFKGRGPGTDAERRAAQHLRRRLESLGREVEVEPTLIRPAWALAHTAYALLGVVASVISTAEPTAAAIAAGVAILLLVADTSGRLHLGRRLTGRRASQNIVSREDGDRPGTLVLVAHYDTAQTGFVYGAPNRVRTWLGARLRRTPGPFGLVLAALAVVLACCIVRATELESVALSAVQFVATVALIFAVTFLADIALSGASPGASDNASGVATVLRLAERYDDDLDHFDVWVLLTGGEEALAEGMREWMRRHRRRLDPTATIFLNVDTVGSGTVRYTRRIGPLLSARTHPRLLEVCRQLTEEDGESGRYGVRPIVLRAIDDALAARRAGFPAVSISCRGPDDRPEHLHRETDTPDHVDDAALDRAFGFCSELIELIDERIGPDVAAAREREQAAQTF
jgi:hypothetical protein